MDPAVRHYMAEIGRRGGKAGRRTLSSDEARRAFRKYYAQCFWSSPADLRISAADVTWVAEQLRKHGGGEAWETADRLCR